MDAICPVEGNDDLYGLGVRIGIYIQLFTVQISGLASMILPIEDHIGQGVVIFTFAVTIVFGRLMQQAEISPAESFIVLSLLLAQVGVTKVPYWKSPFTILLYIGGIVFLLYLYTWFWWHGMAELPRPCEDDYAWFFTRVSLWGWFRTFNRVVSILVVITQSIQVFVYIGSVSFLCWAYASDLIQRLRGVAVERRWNEEGYPTLTSFEILVDIGIIVVVEMTLNYNNIQAHSVARPGQFMPLFISIAQLLGVFYSIVKSLLRRDQDEEEEGPEAWSDLECPHKAHHPDDARVEMSTIQPTTEASTVPV